MTETKVSWVVEVRNTGLQIPQWGIWERYTSEGLAQFEFACQSASNPAAWRLVKETVTVEEVEPNAALVEK